MAIKSLHFINRYPVIKQVARVNLGPKQEVEWVFARVDFQLGLGPCGKVVSSINANYSDHTFIIQQHHDDGTSKDFIYQMSDIAGRIVVEYTEDENNV